MDFIAIDFETANYERESICSIGLAWVQNSEVIRSEERLVRPVPNKFDEYNSYLHGITAETVAEQPTFAEHWAQLSSELEGQTVIAHCTGFDIHAMRDAIRLFDLPTVQFEFFCSMVCSRITFKGYMNYTLDNVCRELGIEMKRHHNAESDAIAAAQIMIKVFEAKGVTHSSEIREKLGVTGGVFGLEEYFKPCNKKWVGPSKTVADLVCTNDNIDEGNPFYGRKVQFPGKLESLTRIEAQQHVLNNGATPAHSMSADVNVLVVGGFDIYSKEFVSSKLQKAMKRIAAGDDLEIINEKEFISLLVNVKK